MGHAMEMQIPDSAPHVKRWYDEVKDRDSVKKSMPTHMPDGSPMPG
jgi:glutathione S-transferase